MIDKTDFDKAFQSGYTFQYNQPYEGGIHDVTFSVHNIGELVVTSGKLVAAYFLTGVRRTGKVSLPSYGFHTLPKRKQ